LRSQSPKLVTQEIWGHLCCHYAIRTLMMDAVDHPGRDPDRDPFAAALRISRRSIARQTAFPPDSDHAIWRLWCHATGELIRRLLPRRQPRANPHVVKRKHTKWHDKRTRHHKCPQPKRLPEQAAVI